MDGVSRRSKTGVSFGLDISAGDTKDFSWFLQRYPGAHGGLQLLVVPVCLSLLFLYLDRITTIAQ